jgi:hypothetical protein
MWDNQRVSVIYFKEGGRGGEATCKFLYFNLKNIKLSKQTELSDRKL